MLLRAITIRMDGSGVLCLEENGKVSKWDVGRETHVHVHGNLTNIDCIPFWMALNRDCKAEVELMRDQSNPNVFSDIWIRKV